MNVPAPAKIPVPVTRPSAAIQVQDLVKRFGTHTILDGITLSIETGETVALIGPSGGGKSTFLRCLNGLNTFDSGAIRGGPHTLKPDSQGGTSKAVCRQIRSLLGMVFQDFQLFPHLTALQNITEAPIQALRQNPVQARERGLQLLERVGLKNRAHHYPRELSGGQKQRVAIARALATEPRALLCDEITSALDPELKVEVLEVLEDLRQEGITLIMVTHEIGFARRAADRVIVLAEGKIVEQGPAAQVIESPTSERTKTFLQCVLG